MYYFNKLTNETRWDCPVGECYLGYLHDLLYLSDRTFHSISFNMGHTYFSDDIFMLYISNYGKIYFQRQ